MNHIKCTRNTSYSIGEGKTVDPKAGEIYSVGRGKDISLDIAIQMIQNRTAVEYIKPTKETLVEENKSTNPVDENKSDESDENNKPLDEMNKDELLAYADKKSIKVKKTLGRDRLYEAIVAAEENNNE